MSELLEKEKRIDGDSSSEPEEKDGGREEDILEKHRERAENVEEFFGKATVNICRQEDSETKEVDMSGKMLVYQKRLTVSDVYYGRITIPFEEGKHIFPKPKKTGGIHEPLPIEILDERETFWTIKTRFDESNNCFMLIIGWYEFVKRNNLKPNDVIIFTYFPFLEVYKTEFKRWHEEEAIVDSSVNRKRERRNMEE